MPKTIVFGTLKRAMLFLQKSVNSAAVASATGRSDTKAQDVSPYAKLGRNTSATISNC